ncbi:MAG TPA: ATP-dependent DNA helicase RecG [Nitrospirales bacterium]|nr:ATP-dependent DNA helicase RecG [Nitrospirales bacterium]HIB53806.1 ATP-dependent DNA helicase RecG [Nitrospirales bacterium]HIC04902.1 ATP-dependent DNA helicase RecG [Nitrospirales bacterium]HIN32869.1 ATP-dependent DNA helicase RecG [Nitrospirales bacterium]HIO21674.1 ATP-dependent DNA helicase RecG [Nitrospirales bacterium]
MLGKTSENHITSLSEIPIQFIRGVGPKKAALFARLGVETAEDLLWHVPRRYEDRSTLRKMSECRPGEECTVVGQVADYRLIRTRRPAFTIFEASFSDSTGMLKVRWFNQPYLADLFEHGQLVMLSGTVQQGRRGGAPPEMQSPIFEIVDEDTDREPIHVGRIVPIYHGTKGVSSRLIRSLVKRVLDQHVDHLCDVVPQDIRERLGLIQFKTAMMQIHFPKGPAPRVDGGSALDSLNRRRSNAHQRLAFDELFLVELGLGMKKVGMKQRATGIVFQVGGPLTERLRQHLPFTLMDAQERVIREMMADMASPYPMNRLLQGDVGCGKTVVAAFAIVCAAESGYQSAVLAPTEILAEQHFWSLRRLLEPLGLRCALVVGGQSKAERNVLLEGIGDGSIAVTIGTHALLHDAIGFNRLGMAVVDEQHKFGVLQRALLKAKGACPDILVMTATPIPRTLALTVYGDLDVSVIDTSPPGRKPIHTIRVLESQRAKAYRLILHELREGRQGFVVYPLVEESEKMDLQAAVSGWEQLKGIFPDQSIGLIHGRMKVSEKEAVMHAFTGGEIRLLVATSVIEVGIDIPNATIMLIEHAERYGLAQLHQLRGRIGRGPESSTCILMTKGGGSPETKRRLDTMVSTNDGFVIAEEDLMMRGPGDFFGTRQWGLPELRVANLIRDVGLLEQARTEAFRLLDEDPELAHPDHAGLRAVLHRRWKGKLDLVGVS